MNTQIKNIVFDWNGTLLDDVDALFDAFNIVFERTGRAPIDLATYQKHYEVPFETLYLNHGVPHHEIEHILETSKDVFHDHYEPMAQRARLRDGATDILSYANANGVQSIILSNHLIDPIRMQLRRLEIEHLFHEVLAYADRATQFKDMTKGERLRRFMAAHNLSPGNTIIIGDSVEEIHIGREQGFVSVGITGGCTSEERLRAENPDYVIHSLAEMKPILVEHGFVS